MKRARFGRLLEMNTGEALFELAAGAYTQHPLSEAAQARQPGRRPPKLEIDDMTVAHGAETVESIVAKTAKIAPVVGVERMTMMPRATCSRRQHGCQFSPIPTRRVARHKEQL